MVSLKSIGEDFGCTAEDVADLLGWGAEMRDIGAENLLVNPTMEKYFRELFSKAVKKPLG